MKNVFSVRKVRVRANGYDYGQWKVEGRINGVRIRKYFANREEAEGFRQLREIEAINRSSDLRPSVTHLTSEQLRTAEAAFKRLAGRPLLDAVEWYLKTYRDTLTTKTVAECCKIFLESKQDHVRESTLQDYRATLRHFSEAYGERILPSVKTEEIEHFLVSRELKGKSWNNTRADLHALFSWCAAVPRSWITENPVHPVRKMPIARGLPEVLTAAQAGDLMSYVATYAGVKEGAQKPGFLVPYFALALFAGIRPAINGGELVRLAEVKRIATHIDLENRVIRITPEIAKTKDVRQIVLQPNLERWLRAFPLSRHAIIPRNAFDEITGVRHRFSIGHDVLRHTFIVCVRNSSLLTGIRFNFDRELEAYY